MYEGRPIAAMSATMPIVTINSIIVNPRIENGRFAAWRPPGIDKSPPFTDTRMLTNCFLVSANLGLTLSACRCPMARPEDGDGSQVRNCDGHHDILRLPGRNRSVNRR